MRTARVCSFRLRQLTGHWPLHRPVSPCSIAREILTSKLAASKFTSRPAPAVYASSTIAPRRVRPTQTADFVEYVRLCDGLAHVDYPATAFSTADVEPQVSDAWRLYLCLTNT